MVSRRDRQTREFPDGSEVEFTIRTDDATVFRVFRADMARRLRSAQRTFGTGAGRTSPAVGSTGRGHTRQSTTAYTLPDGEVTVVIDASGTASHAYLRSLVRGAVEYTHTLHVDFGRATLLAVLCIGAGVALVALGRVFLSVPLFGVGGSVAFHLLVYWLSARGVAPNLSRIPEPGGPRR